MPPEQMSGLYLPNRIARIYMLAMEEVVGSNGLNALLNLAHLGRYIGSYPPDNLKREFDFAELSALNAALEDMYGPRGGRGLALRAGRACFSHGLRNFGALAGFGDAAFRALPLQARLKMGVPAVATVFNHFSDQQIDVTEAEEQFVYAVRGTCPVCFGRSTDQAAGHMMVGLLQEGLRWMSGGHEFRVFERQCIAAGAPDGVFVIYRDPIG